jgi:hypothetical protein
MRAALHFLSQHIGVALLFQFHVPNGFASFSVVQTRRLLHDQKWSKSLAAGRLD